MISVVIFIHSPRMHLFVTFFRIIRVMNEISYNKKTTEISFNTVYREITLKLLNRHLTHCRQSVARVRSSYVLLARCVLKLICAVVN